MQGALHPPGLDREALEVAIVTAVKSSVSGAFASLRTDVQQLDARLDTWWSQNDQARQVPSPTYMITHTLVHHLKP